MTALEEAQDKLSVKQKELAEIFATSPDMNMSEDVVKDVRARNDELSELGKKAESLREMERIAGETKKLGDELKKPTGGMTFPDPNSKGGSANNFNPSGAQFKSIGQMFVDSPAFKAYNRATKSSPASEIVVPEQWFQAKTLFDETGFAPQAVRTGLILPGLLRRPVVADLIPQTTTNQIAVVYMEETTTTNSADTVLEGGSKPESALSFTERTSSVRKIATVLPVTDELMADEPMMRGYVEQRMRLFLQLAEETQLLSGDGTAPDLTGIANVDNILTQAKSTDPTPDAVYKAMTKIQVNSFLPPSGMVIHPNDWQDIRLLRTTDGIYLWGNPSDPGPERIWGLPVVVTTAATEGTAIVAAFDTAMQIARRSEVTFAVSDQHSDFFIKNQLMLRVEERLAFVVYRPSGVCTVTGI